MSWTKSAGDRWTFRRSSDDPYTVKVFPRGDGRWVWEILAGDATNPTATGIARNLGAAKTVSTQLLERSFPAVT
ncbi:MAG: hypothetical protein EOO75_07345 [Myxococcales bacterium]|nr:MAG: hypothetical protein EOO75_07345 [Myxococcales bacterium]